MKSSYLYKEYVWLLNLLKRYGSLTFEEINNQRARWGGDFEKPLSRATFNRYRDAISEIFGVEIECDRHDGCRYRLANADQLADDSLANWMLSTLTVSQVVRESDSLRGRIMTEPVYSNPDFLMKVITAMKMDRKVSVDYQRFTSSKVRSHVLMPYGLKMHKQRWYMVGVFDDPGAKRIGMFSLDRMKRLELTDETFTMDPDFDCEEYFSDCFGVVQGDGMSPCRIVIRAFDVERLNVKSLPMHHSQTCIGEGVVPVPDHLRRANDPEDATVDYADFQIYMRPTLDFSSYILQRGFMMQVLEPQWLAEEICDMHWSASMLYPHLEEEEREEEREEESDVASAAADENNAKTEPEADA